MGLLRRPAIKREFKLSGLLEELRDRLWRDDLPLDRRMIENNPCPSKKCRKFLVYRGYSNAEEYRAYGVCESCDYARLFWTESQTAAAAKKSILQKAA